MSEKPLGLTSWSYHNLIFEGKITIEEVIRRCSEMGLDGIEIEPSHIPDQSEAGLISIRKLLDKHQLEFVLGGDCGCATEEQRENAIQQLELAAKLGATRMRITPSMREEPTKANLEAMAEGMKELAQVAQQVGIPLALENHDALSGQDPLLYIIETCDSPYLRVTLDTTNGRKQGQDDLEAARSLAPYAIHTHLKDEIEEAGEPRAKALGEGTCPLFAIFDLLARQNYQGLSCIEIAARKDDLDEDRAVAKSVDFLRRTLR